MTRTSSIHRTQARAQAKRLLHSNARGDAVDLASIGSFPASDPPPWTLGISKDDNAPDRPAG